MGLSKTENVIYLHRFKFIYPYVHRLLTVPARMLNYFLGICYLPVFLDSELTVNNQ